MQDLYYVVEKQLKDIDGLEEATGWKDIRVYDIDTQSMTLVVVCELDVKNTLNSEKEIQAWLDNQEIETEYSFIEL